jgi:hypothetical protein
VVEKTALKEAIMVVITIPRIKKESRISSKVKPSLVAGCRLLDTRYWIMATSFLLQYVVNS